jgi:hypothetical protein
MARKETVSAVAERVAAALHAPELMPGGMAAAAIRWAARQKFEPDREEEAAAEILHFGETVTKLLLGCDYREVLRQIAHFKRRIRECSAGGPAPERSQLERLATVLQDGAGYNGFEIEAIGLVLKPGETIGPFDSREIQIGDRVWDRAELRQRMRPQSWTNDESWNGQFPDIPNEGGRRFNVN